MLEVTEIGPIRRMKKGGWTWTVTGTGDVGEKVQERWGTYCDDSGLVKWSDGGITQALGGGTSQFSLFNLSPSARRRRVKKFFGLTEEL